MPRSETLLEIRSVRSPPWPESRRPLPLTHSKPPAITSFQGASEYLMDLMARIDAPLFHDVTIRCFHPLIFSIPQPAPLFSRTTKFKASYHPRVVLYSHRVRVVLSFTNTDIALWNILTKKKTQSAGQNGSCKPAPETKVSLSSPVQVCASSCLPLST